MRKDVESRIEKLEEKEAQGKGGYTFVLLQPGESEDQALRRTMREDSKGNSRPKHFRPFFCTELDWKI